MTHIRPERWGLNGLLATGALALAPHVPRLPLWIVLVCSGGMLWRLGIDNRNWPKPTRILRLALTVLIVAATYEHYGTLLGRDAGTGLLASLLALKLLELRQLRDCVVAVCLCYLLALSAFLYSQTPALVAYGIVVVLASIATLIRLNQPNAAPLAYSLRLAATLLLKAVPLMLAMFVLFPRIQGSLWALPTDARSHYTGMSAVMQPGSIHHLTTSDAPAFRVTFEGKTPPPTQLYWRGLVLWHTDGRRWVAGEPTSALAQSSRFTRLGAPVKYTVTLEPSDQPWMLALDLPIVVPDGARPRPGYLLEHRTPIRERLQYTLISFPEYRTAALDPQERRYALQLPDNVSARVRGLAQTWRSQSTDSLAITRMALDYFREQRFSYTLDPPLLGKDPVDEFLFSTRRGFCGHFASAFVTLMRAANVPSRVVTGYQGGEFNSAGGYYLVRQADAHAWAEIWVPEHGWLRVDPTAAVAPERVELGIDAVRELRLRGVELGRFSTEAVRKLLALGWFAASQRTLRFYWDAANLAWHRSVLGYDQQRQQRLLSQLHLPKLSWRGLLAILLVTLVGALMILAVLKPRARRVDPIQALYRRFCDRLARIGIERRDAEGALAFSQRAAAARPDLKAAVDAVTELYVRLRYGAPTDSAHIRLLQREVSQFQPARR